VGFHCVLFIGLQSYQGNLIVLKVWKYADLGILRGTHIPPWYISGSIDFSYHHPKDKQYRPPLLRGKSVIVVGEDQGLLPAMQEQCSSSWWVLLPTVGSRFGMPSADECVLLGSVTFFFKFMVSGLVQQLLRHRENQVHGWTCTLGASMSRQIASAILNCITDWSASRFVLHHNQICQEQIVVLHFLEMNLERRVSPIHPLLSSITRSSFARMFVTSAISVFSILRMDIGFPRRTHSNCSLFLTKPLNLSTPF
jgi:hypothetical protein